jgi:hypothetical protein
MAQLPKPAWILLILLAPGLARGAEPSFEWTLDACVSRQLSARQLEPLIALEGQTVEASVPAAGKRHTQIHISCADDTGRRLVVTTQVTAEVASRTIDLEDTADALRPRVVALAATELLRRINVLPPKPTRAPETTMPTTPRPATQTAAATLTPALAPPPPSATAPANRWLSLQTTRGVGYGLLGASAALTIVAFGITTSLVAARSPTSDSDPGSLQVLSEFAIGAAAVTSLAALGTIGWYGYTASRDAAASRLPPTAAQLRIGRAALALTALGVATLVPATVTLALAAHAQLPPEESRHTQTLYYSATGLYAAATVTLLTAAGLGAMWWGHHQPPLRLALRPSFYASGAGLGLAGRF